MTGNLVSRQASPAAAPVSMQAETDAMLQKARLIAAAGPDVLPEQYVDNPGAVLMALDWSTRHDVSIFETMAEVSFNRGRPTVGARLQRKLASRFGFITRRIEGDATRCVVAVLDPAGHELGRAEYTYAQAEALGIIYRRDGQTLKSTWAGDPAQMLYHRATTRALDYYGPAELATGFVESDPTSSALYLDDPTPAAAELEHQDDEPATLPVGDDTGQDAADDAEAPTNGPTPTPPTADELKAALRAKGIKQATAVAEVRKMHPKSTFDTFADVVKHHDAAIDLADWIDQA